MSVEEDYQAWREYPQYRWVFNKLEFALQMGYHAGPTGVPIQRSGMYVIRPTYNLYGMGIGARKKFLTPSRDAEDMIALAHVPPGYFWCEYLYGKHYSVDLMRENGEWVPFCTTVGTHRTDENLVMFDSWEKVDTPIDFKIPDFIQSVIKGPQYLNVEMKGNNIFELHLRSGNDHFWDYPVGTIMYPVWDSDPEDYRSDLPFIGNLHSDSFMYSASGHLQVTRLGYRVKEPSSSSLTK